MRLIIGAEDVPAKFDDACIRRLAGVAMLPSNADVNAFGNGVREAACIFAREAREPRVNELRDEIAALYDAADRRLFERVATLLNDLSPRARALLCDRGARPNVGLKLPSAGALLDPEQRATACATIVTLCWQGGDFVPGRRRPSGKQSRPVFRQLLYAPEPRRNFPKRDAERNFVMWLSVAYLEATGIAPSRTARHGDAGRKPGPFARFVRECLDLVGAWDADAVELIKEMNWRRCEMEKGRG